MIGCSILSSMLQEYATTVRSSDVGLAWEVHFSAKKQFEVQRAIFLTKSVIKCFWTITSLLS